MHRRVSQRAVYWRHVIHLRTLKASGISPWYFMPNRSTPDYWFEKAEQCFRRARIDSNARVKLDALGNVFMVKAVELDTKLQKLAKATTPLLPPARA
jgi:hypothetical protein